MEKKYYITREQYLTMKSAWVAKSSHSAAEIIIYNALRDKPIDCGFSEKKNNIQCNDSWNGFNMALKHAMFITNRVCPYDKIYTNMLDKWNKRIETYKANFKMTFGIDMPDDLFSKFDGKKK